MKKIVLNLIIFFCITFLFSQTTIPAGPVSGTWDLAGSPYLIDGEISIPDGQTLSIEPGCLIEFQGHYEFKVFGQIIAAGTQQDSIKFTAIDINSGWFGLRFQEETVSADTSTFSYCIFEYSRATGVATYLNGGAIYVFSGNNIIFSNCRFSDNYAYHDGGAIYCRDSNLQISGCTFKYNVANQERGGAINIDNSIISIDNTNISHNQSDNHGGAVYCRNSEFAISNSLISYNFDYGGTSGGLYISNSSIQIFNNTLHNNSSDPFYDSEGTIKMYNCVGTVQHNTLYNNYCDYSSISAAINCMYSDLDIIENTIYENESSGIISSFSESYIQNNTIHDNEYHGVSVYAGSNVVVENNQIYNNEDDGIQIQQSSARIEKNTITGNENGISITNDSSPLIRNNVICENIYDGVNIDESNPIIINSTIANNATRSIDIDSDCSLILINSILWGNQYSPIHGSWQNRLYISNCCIDNSITNITPVVFENNIAIDPFFSVNGYYLCCNSPCIDAGAEWIGSDEDGSIIDIGCYTTSEFAGSGELPPNMVSGSIAGDITEDVILFGDVTVDVDDQLIIDPGVKISCFGALNVLGSIMAVGSPSQYIEFTGVDEFPWSGIKIESSFGYINGFDYCNFSDATSSALSVLDSNINVINCNFNNNTASNGGAIYIKINDENDININITNNQFDYNHVYEKGGAININNWSEESVIQILNNYFTGNSSDSNGGALYTYSYTGNSNYNYDISNNVFSQNQASQGGGACIGDNANVHDNSFINNQASYNGGGVSIYGSLFYNNIIDGNTAHTGGGVYSGRAFVINNIISNNSASTRGGGLRTYGVDAEKNKTIGNLIINNQVQYEGGGIFVSGENIITNCTIVSNTSDFGAGIYCENSFNSEMQNCIVYENIANEDSTQIFLHGYWFHDYDQGSHTWIHEWRPANLNVHYSNIEGGYENIYMNYDGSTPEYPIIYDFDYENNYNQDPLFLSEDNFHLDVTSQCINSGTPDTTGLSLPEYDLEGNQRILGSSIDLGCFESQVAYVENLEIDFGEVEIMAVSEDKEISIINPIDQDIQISNITVSDNYFIKLLDQEEYSCQLTNISIPANSQISLWIVCTPTDQGELDGEIIIESNNFSSENTIEMTSIGIYLFRLYNNFPNPFNPETTIKFSIPQESEVELIIYNIKGQKVKTLVNDMCETGINTAIWNGTNDSGKHVGTGVYFYKLKVDNKVINTRKMLLLK